MAKGISLHIGLNSVDPVHYAGWSGPLNACEADAEDMAEISKTCGFTVKKLLTKSGTRSAVEGSIREAAQQLDSGDFFFLSYSGHGGQVPDLDGDEDDNLDETWCLFDGELIDDELYALLGQFREGVRVLVLSDSCHSGSVTKAAHYGALAASGALDLQTSSAQPLTRFRAMPEDVAIRTYSANKAQYQALQSKTDPDAKDKIKATVRLISGCQDNQLSSDGTFNGLFTGTLLKVWNSGKFVGDYEKFYNAIRKRMPPSQTPNHFLLGKDNSDYDEQRPFTINPKDVSKDASRIAVEVILDGKDFTSLSEKTLRSVFDQLPARLLEILRKDPMSSKDWSTSVSGNAGSGGWQAGGSVTYSWKAPATKDGSASVSGSAGPGGWQVGGSITVHF